MDGIFYMSMLDLYMTGFCLFCYFEFCAHRHDKTGFIYLVNIKAFDFQ